MGLGTWTGRDMDNWTWTEMPWAWLPLTGKLLTLEGLGREKLLNSAPLCNNLGYRYVAFASLRYRSDEWEGRCGALGFPFSYFPRSPPGPRYKKAAQSPPRSNLQRFRLPTSPRILFVND